MRWPGRGRRVPGSVLALLGVGSGERVLGWGSTDQAGGTQTVVTVATDQALYVQAAGVRVPWERVVKATWDEPALTVVHLGADGRPAPALRVRVDDPGDLPAAVHDRVVASVLVSERRQIGPAAKALFVARRLGDEVRWTVVFDPGVDAGDPAMRAAADAELAEMRTTLGV